MIARPHMIQNYPPSRNVRAVFPRILKNANGDERGREFRKRRERGRLSARHVLVRKDGLRIWKIGWMSCSGKLPRCGEMSITIAFPAVAGCLNTVANVLKLSSILKNQESMWLERQMQRRVLKTP